MRVSGVDIPSPSEIVQNGLFTFGFMREVVAFAFGLYIAKHFIAWFKSAFGLTRTSIDHVPPARGGGDSVAPERGG